MSMQSSQYTRTTPRSLSALPRDVMVSFFFFLNKTVPMANFYVSELKLTLINIVYRNRTYKERKCVTIQNLTGKVNWRVAKGAA